ncbi:hypothetical protein H9Y04_01690 [Streptomyces sp. TRM66268-LWL]|uniref:ABC transporter permease n=1 Tax=Streptomyces polyasparticus TaxID=2767826 RepID=A0ABR7SA94_9ACTN|nr:hypothetical protein [Streptomyces polyasparticus]
MTGRLDGRLLYARSRGLPLALLVLACLALATAWGAAGPASFLDFERRVPVIAAAPLLAAAVIGTSLHEHSAELDRTAARPWWLWRLVQIGALTALAAAALALAVPGRADLFGAAAMVRATLGATGIAAASATVLGARLSWLPGSAYIGAVYLRTPLRPGGAAEWWAWPMQPGPQDAAWTVAAVLFAGGTALYALRGAKAEPT